MNNRNAVSTTGPTAQEVCIDLPGEAVQCWRSTDKVKVILRKHRDVIFDININPGATYTVESGLDFYCSRDKKLLKLAHFQDGERFHIWIGRNFKGSLVLKSGGFIMGSYEANVLDSKEYDANPKTKPEPLLVIFGKKILPSGYSCPGNDPTWWTDAQKIFHPMYDPLVSSLKNYGSEHDYRLSLQLPDVQEYVAIAEASGDEIQPQVLKQLDGGLAVEGEITDIFNRPSSKSTELSIYAVIISTFAFVTNNNTLTSNEFKESIGYIQENWKSLDKSLMTVRIEKRVIGKYKVIFKGRRLTTVFRQLLRGASSASVVHNTVRLGSADSAFIDGGFKRAGRSGFGGVKRLMLTLSENFRGGVKIQIIGTVLDIFGDAATVYSSEKGSKDLSEFLGRAGVSILKAAATAAIGSVLAALIVALLAGAIEVGVPVALVAVMIIVGYILTATFVDYVDDKFGVKDTVGNWAR